MNRLFLFILTSSFYASVTGAVIYLLKKLLKDKLTPRWHYLIWMVLIVKLLVPVGPQSSISLFNIINLLPAHQSPGDFLYRQPEILEPVTVPDMTDTTPPAGLVSEPPETTQTDSPLKINVPLVIWVIGVCFLAIWLLFVYISVTCKIRKSKLVTDPKILKILELCKEKMNITKNIKAVVRDDINSPSLYGIFKPVILLNTSLLLLNENEIRYVLMHELAHYKRKDLSVNNILLALLVFHWFNPLIWYFFKCIRRDMETATDEYVLTVLGDGENYAYGRSLITVLENFGKPKGFPKLIGMTDDKKNIERRIMMIKKSDIYKNRRRIAWILGIACIFVTGVVLLTGGLSDIKPAWASVAEYDAVDLYKFKSLYIGDASNVGNLAGRLPLGEYRNGMELFTEKEPYGLLINYVLPDDIDFVWRLDNNACIMFSLISNLSEVTYKVTYKNETAEYSYSRSLLEERFNISFSDLGKDEKSFSDFLKDISMKIYVYPQYYASVMSSVPGIQIQSVYTGAVRNVKYSCENGVLLYWDVYSGQNPKGVKSIEVPYGTHIYWSPLVGINEFVTEDVIYVTLTDFQDDQIREKKIQVVTGENGFYTVTPTPDIVFGIGRRSQSLKPTSLNDAISQAVKGQGKSYSTGEYLVEGHVILGDDVKDNEMTVYTVVSVGWFGFENDIFTKISGSGAIPTVMRFSIDDQNGYSLLEYKEPRDGSEYSQSIKSMFPKNLHDKLFSNEFNSSLKEQQEYQAAEYLTRIGRNAQVTCDYVPKTLVDINVHASNKLFSEYGKFDEFINNCPYWIGTREKIENSVRYIYKTSQSKTEDGYDLIIFGKLTEDGTVVKEVLYKINGTEPVLIE